MIKFENGRHLANYLLKILRNTNDKLTWKEEKILKQFSTLYDFIEFYIDVAECPAHFDSSFTTWIDYAKNGNVNQLCNVVENSLLKIEQFKNREISFDCLFEVLDLNMKYRSGYLDKKPKNSDIYYPYNLEVLSTKIRKSTGIIRCYTNPKDKLTNNYGCYFIYDNKGEIVYIGKSNANLLHRASASARQRIKTCCFSKIELLEMPSHADTNIYEMYYIAKFNPIYNADARCEDYPTCELKDIATHHVIDFVEEKPFEVKQMCFEKEYVSKEEFWHKGNYLLYNESNIEKQREQLCNNNNGIIDGEYLFSQKELYEQDGYLCTLYVTDRNLETIDQSSSQAENI